MRKINGSILVAFWLACAQSTVYALEVSSPVASDEVKAQTLDGPFIAERLTTFYNRAFENCFKSPSKPAFLCSGLTFRQTVKDPANQYKVWEPSPTSVKSGGVSFSYLRADANFGKGGWRAGANGLIIWPIFEAPASKEKFEYLCSNPMDTWGWTRSLTEVCGPHPAYRAQSQVCQNSNITTGEQWLALWKKPGGNAYQRQCGFDVRDARNTLAGPAFYQSLRAKNLMGAEGFGGNNELIVKTWTSRNADTFPIMAFFYVYPATGNALADAQYNQRDFYHSTQANIIVPIIRLTPPAALGGKASFTFDKADQALTQ